MIEYQTNADNNWNAWFWVDREESEGGWKIGQLRYRTEKAVGRGNDGKLLLMVWTNRDPYDWRKYTQALYEIDLGEYTSLLDRAIAQGEVKSKERDHLLAKAKAPFIPPWDIHKAVVVYQDERYTLGQQNDLPYLIVKGERYTLTCHPYEPCLYISGDRGSKTAVHNAFDPFYALEAFHRGETITSITGFEYDAKAFCRMVDYAANLVDLQIDEAEKVFGGPTGKAGPKQKAAAKERPDRAPFHSEAERVAADDPFYRVIDEYPDSAVEFCLVKNEHIAHGRYAHWYALVQACRNLFFDGSEKAVWRYDCLAARGKQVETAVLFADASRQRGVNYRGAFRFPPYGVRYSDQDFDRINASLFPNGTDELEVYEWTTDWSEYFDDGHEWWGALCYTVYDKTLDRFAVIMASATD